ncbi:MAG: hypothetical protein H6916_04480 [Novosphingobium sp.]|uniref:DUF7007 domain-containing protein n=1 Tax=Novosphingobium sp. TaxID=1874826 RepID=UPI00260B54D7|nr:hypothetical protein [Novosphingobium sp.]MCP5386060.1 hypothetical protein [Novosphingobium sp.]
MSSALTIPAQFARTAEGHLAAQVDDLGWLAIPVANGLRMASAWRLSKPIDTWVMTDFHGADGFVADETAFRAHVEDVAQHKRELAALPRPETGMRVGTPWGTSQQSYRYADGILCHSTAGHGGFFLSTERNALVDAQWRNADGWYEEDAEWAKVAFTFPDRFTTRERRCAAETLRHDYPDVWEQMHGVTLAPGESRVKDERQFRADHAADWVVVAAIRSDRHPGFVECVAKIGGNRALAEERLYLVPGGEYHVGRFGFVIDEGSHLRLDRRAA